jgi:TolB-like protein
MAESLPKLVRSERDGDTPSRTSGKQAAERYRLGDLIVDVGGGAVTRGDEALALSPLTFDLLLALVRRAPQVVRRQELLATVWPNEFVNDDTLSQRVRLLREALGDLAEEPRYLALVRGWGYRLIPEVGRLPDEVTPIRALAVLPLANITGDPQQEYFADGMTETLILQLAKIRSLKIISRTSVMRYKHAERHLPQIARELAVDAVVEGTVLVAGGRVRVSVQLIRAATDENLWAESYDRELEDVFALHADLARSIAHEIRALITPEERERLETHHRVNAVAHESDLRARYFLGKFTPPDVERAIAHFEQAIAQDAAFAYALAGLAHACFERALPLGGDLSVPSQRALLCKAKAAAKRAISIDGTLAVAHATLGITLLFYDWDWHGAETALENALELDSNSGLAHGFLGALAATTADSPRTIREMRRALELDPLNLLLRAEAAETCYWIRDYSQAVEYASQTLDLDPLFLRAHFVLGRLHEAQGRIAEAITEYEQAGTITAGTDAARRALQEGGAAGYHRWALCAGITSIPHAAGAFRGRPFYRAKAHARLGEVDEAIRCLEQSYEQRECLMVVLKTLEWWDPLRSDARFADLVRRVGIP